MNTCSSMKCPYVFLCKEYNFGVDRGEHCEFQDEFYKKATMGKSVAPCNIGDKFYYPIPVLDKIFTVKVSMMTLTKKGVWKIRFDSTYCQDLPYTDFNIKFFDDYAKASEYIKKYREMYYF